MAKLRYNYNQYETGKNENMIITFDIFEKYGIENYGIILIEKI